MSGARLTGLSILMGVVLWGAQRSLTRDTRPQMPQPIPAPSPSPAKPDTRPDDAKPRRPIRPIHPFRPWKEGIDE